MLNDADHRNVIQLLNLPPQTNLRPVIRSEGGLSDENFKIILDGWLNDYSVKTSSQPQRIGAVLTLDSQQYLLNEHCFKLVESIKEFSHLQNKDKQLNQKNWAKIRNIANKANANLDDFLKKTIVVVPEKLQLNLRKNVISHESIVEVQPSFDEMPANWLNQFDQNQNVRDEYSMSLPNGGLIHVVIDPQVKTILNEIKKMPNRRISGERAQAFIHNPFAQLGDDAIDVISPESFETSKKQADIYTYTIKVEKQYNDLEQYENAKLILFENSEREQNPIILQLSNIEQTAYFIQAYEKKSPFFTWAGYEIERSYVLDQEIQSLKNELNEIQKYEDELQAKQVLDLSNYSGRVIGIGEAEILNSQFIKKDSGDSDWLPQHLTSSEQQLLDEKRDESIIVFEELIKQAEKNQIKEIILPNTDTKLSIEHAKEILIQLKANKNKYLNKKPETQSIQDKKKKDTLLIANNIDEVEFAKLRGSQLTLDESKSSDVRLPSSFRRQEFNLKNHQLYGIAWLQNLHQYAPNQVSGCLLADDMGLGKTLQLLCFIGEYLENSEREKPALIVAPVSLLENWAAEANRFFSARFPKILSLYGENLKERKIPKHLISSQLRDNHGITNLLEEGWLGDAGIVLTTYETLRDLEFSLARQDWSIMVCDEAQKIKVPTAMVTKAAKAQKADFKIACTGTPVENSLTDLWCLFDFIQENLLGPLNEFGKNYRKPIENMNESDDTTLLKLREIIAPQVLRRMKYDVADLPPKSEVLHCKNIVISPLQKQLYVKVVNDFKTTDNKGAMLTSLHHMRMICAHPFQLEPSATLKDSPKVNWLLDTLENIKQRNEKVIIFTEFRDIQVFLMRILMERFGLNIITVNGDSNTNSKKGLTRQNLIDKFQNKSGFNIIILSTTAVGFGVNIQKANHVIHYTRSWNPAKEDQATDRAYRIGQEKEVFVYYPTIEAENFDTFEVKLDRLLSSKRELADDMLNPTGDLTKDLIDIVA